MLWVYVTISKKAKDRTEFSSQVLFFIFRFENVDNYVIHQQSSCSYHLTKPVSWFHHSGSGGSSWGSWMDKLKKIVRPDLGLKGLSVSHMMDLSRWLRLSHGKYWGLIWTVIAFNFTSRYCFHWRCVISRPHHRQNNVSVRYGSRMER